MTSANPSAAMTRQRADQEIACEVLLDDLTVMADIGALAAEQGVRQPLRIHVALSVVPPLDDDLAQTYDYVAIKRHARELAGQRISLIETFARRLALACLASDLVLAAEVRIEKPLAVPGSMAGTRLRLRKPMALARG